MCVARLQAAVGAGRRIAVYHARRADLDERSAGELPPHDHLRDGETRVLVEQTTMLDPQRLGRPAGRLEASELRALDEALALILGL